MRKILLLIIFSVFIVGCEAIYTIEINDNSFKETLEINNFNPDSWNKDENSYEELVRTNAKSNIPVNYEYEVVEKPIQGVVYYQINLIDTPQNLGLRYSHTFNSIEEYAYSTLALYHFSSFRAIKVSNNVRINTGIINYSFDNHEHLTKFTVRLVTNYEVKEHNADEIKDDVLYWYFDRNNYENKEINVAIDMDSIANPQLFGTDNEGYFGVYTLIVFYGLIGVILIFIGLFIYFKVKKSNI